MSEWVTVIRLRRNNLLYRKCYSFSTYPSIDQIQEKLAKWKWFKQLKMSLWETVNYFHFSKTHFTRIEFDFWKLLEEILGFILNVLVESLRLTMNKGKTCFQRETTGLLPSILNKTMKTNHLQTQSNIYANRWAKN